MITMYLQYPAKFAAAVNTLIFPDPEEPDAPDPKNHVQFELWKLDTKEHRPKMKEYSNFWSGLYNLVLGQCTEALLEHCKSHEDFPEANQNGTPISLLIIIQSLIRTSEERRKLADALADEKESFYHLWQGKYMKLERYHELFLAQVEVLNEVGITIPDTALITSIANSHASEEPNDDDHQEAKTGCLDHAFIHGKSASHHAYLQHLRNTYLDRVDVYPSSVHCAYNILRHTEEDHIGMPNEQDGLSFAQVGQCCDMSQVTCYGCGRWGHFANSPECPNN